MNDDIVSRTTKQSEEIKILVKGVFFSRLINIYLNKVEAQEISNGKSNCDDPPWNRDNWEPYTPIDWAKEEGKHKSHT